ncbi:MAG: GntR family transcriptional regulator [Pseudomonadota bacterium]|jgi:DNA-binding GntR family transcriptional regulator
MSTSPPQRRTPYERIKARVLDRDFRPGQFLRVAQLADELTVSATPIREALVRLASEGLLTEVHGRGYFVSRLTESDLRDLYRLGSSICRRRWRRRRRRRRAKWNGRARR